MKKTLPVSLTFTGIVLLGILIAPPTSHAATPITGCTVITVPGAYTISNDITASTNPCIRVGVDNVSIDGQGHTITGTTGGGAEGIHVEDYINATISNIHVTNFDTGISLLNTSNILIQNIQADFSATNIYMDTVASSTIIGSTIATSTTANGINAKDITGFRVLNNTFSDNGGRAIGILSNATSSSNLVITGNTFTDSLGDEMITFYGNQNNILVH